MLHVSSLSLFAHQLRSLWMRRFDRVHFRRELEQSSDRTLADMGICRGDITAVVDGSFGRN